MSCVHRAKCNGRTRVDTYDKATCVFLTVLISETDGRDVSKGECCTHACTLYVFRALFADTKLLLE